MKTMSPARYGAFILDCIKTTIETKRMAMRINAINDQLRATLEDKRREAGLCIECGRANDNNGMDICAKCYMVSASERYEEHKHPDDKG
jgi:hypothetical protein